MFRSRNDATANNLADRAASSAGHAIDSTRASTHDLLDSVSQSLEHLRERASPALDRASEIAHRSGRYVRDGSRQLRAGAEHAGENTALYIREAPFKSIMIAAAAGAVIALLAGWLGSNPDDRRR